MAKRQNLDALAEVFIDNIDKLEEFTSKIEKATGKKIEVDTTEIDKLRISLNQNKKVIQEFLEHQKQTLSNYLKGFDKVLENNLKRVEEAYPKEVKGVVENQHIYNIHTKSRKLMINSFLVFIPLVVVFGFFAGFAYTYEFKPKYDAKVMEEQHEMFLKEREIEKKYIIDFGNHMASDKVFPKATKKYIRENPLPERLKKN